LSGHIHQLDRLGAENGCGVLHGGVADLGDREQQERNVDDAEDEGDAGEGHD
jgi:hypothetical protein